MLAAAGTSPTKPKPKARSVEELRVALRNWETVQNRNDPLRPGANVAIWLQSQNIVNALRWALMMRVPEGFAMTCLEPPVPAGTN